MTGIARNNIARYIPYNRHTDINIKQNKNTLYFSEVKPFN